MPIIIKIANLMLSPVMDQLMEHEDNGISEALAKAIPILNVLNEDCPPERMMNPQNVQSFGNPMHSMFWDQEWPDKSLYVMDSEEGRAMQVLSRVLELKAPVIFARFVSRPNVFNGWEFNLFYHALTGDKTPDVAHIDLKAGIIEPFKDVSLQWGELPPAK